MLTLLVNQIRLFLILAVVVIATTHCQVALPTTPESRPATATPILIPTIPPGDGSDLLDQLLESGRLRVGVRVWPEADFSPPVFRAVTATDAGGALTGYEVEIARLVAAGLGLELELVEADPRLLVTGGWTNEWDIGIGSLTPVDQAPPGEPVQERAYSTPYGFIPMGILIPASEENINDLGDLFGRRVGVLEHSIYPRLLTPDGAQLTVQQQPFMLQPPADVELILLSNLQKSIRELGAANSEAEGQPDAIFGPTPMFEQAISRDLPVGLAPQAERVGLQPVSIVAVPRDGLTTDRLINEINKILARLREQGDLAEIYQYWTNQDLSRVQ